MCVDKSRAGLLSAKQAAGKLAISTRKLWSMTASGELPTVRIGRCVRFDPRDLQMLIESKKQGNSPER